MLLPGSGSRSHGEGRSSMGWGRCPGCAAAPGPQHRVAKGLRGSREQSCGGLWLCPALGHSGSTRSSPRPQFLRSCGKGHSPVRGDEGRRWARAGGQCPVARRAVTAERCCLRHRGRARGWAQPVGGLMQHCCLNPGAGGSPPRWQQPGSALPAPSPAASRGCAAGAGLHLPGARGELVAGELRGRGLAAPPQLSPGTRLAQTQPGAVWGGVRPPQRGAWLPAPHRLSPLAPFLAPSSAACPGHHRPCPHHVLTRARARLLGTGLLARARGHGEPWPPHGTPLCPRHPALLPRALRSPAVPVPSRALSGQCGCSRRTTATGCPMPGTLAPLGPAGG